MSDVKYGFNWTVISGGVGTAVIANRPTTLVRILIPGTYIGTVSFDDAAGTAGTTSTSQIFSLPIPSTSVAGNIEVGAGCKNGLVYSATGTPTVTVIWD